MNNRVLNQRKAARLKYRCKIRGCTSKRLHEFALRCFLIDYMSIDAKAIMDDPKKCRAVKEMLGL